MVLYYTHKAHYIVMNPSAAYCQDTVSIFSANTYPSLSLAGVTKKQYISPQTAEILKGLVANYSMSRFASDPKISDAEMKDMLRWKAIKAGANINEVEALLATLYPLTMHTNYV